MKRHVRPTLVFLFTAWVTLVLQAQPIAPPQPFTGKVVAIADGDTLTVLLGQTQHRIRLQHIDAPESGQDYGTRARLVRGRGVPGDRSWPALAGHRFAQQW